MSVLAQNLSVKFGEFYAVRNVSFAVEHGEIFGFLGANGAGKTTTIRVLCGLLPPSEGHVAVNGATYGEGEQKIKEKVGYMSQRFTLYNDLTVEENLVFAGRLRRLEQERFLRRRDELLEFIGFSTDRRTFVRDLPGGIKQQVSLAAALLHDPDIIFLDEPTAGVSPAARARFWALIRDLKARRKTVFVTTHYMDEAEYCGRIALMRAGELIALDTIPALKKSAFPEPIYSLEPRGEPLTHTELRQFAAHSAVRTLQPYGIRYHLAAKSRAAFEAARAHFSERFAISETAPSLEDVFIELVEGKGR
jgi:ABC-2 type transport system ATP-binding protein